MSLYSPRQFRSQISQFFFGLRIFFTSTANERERERKKRKSFSLCLCSVKTQNRILIVIIKSLSLTNLKSLLILPFSLFTFFPNPRLIKQKSIFPFKRILKGPSFPWDLSKFLEDNAFGFTQVCIRFHKVYSFFLLGFIIIFNLNSFHLTSIAFGFFSDDTSFNFVLLI